MANTDSSHPHLHHQYYSVERNKHHDKILKLGGNDTRVKHDLMANTDSSHPHLHHQYYSVERNKHHDEILKLRGNDQLPYFILDGQSILWHEAA